MASRSRHTPSSRGWVVTRDMTRALLHSIDCSQGGVQEAFTRECAELATDGWNIGSRFADSLFAERALDRVRVTIEAFDPGLPTPLHRSTP